MARVIGTLIVDGVVVSQVVEEESENPEVVQQISFSLSLTPPVIGTASVTQQGQ